MQDETMQDFVVKHALESEKNLEVACLVRSSFDGIQRRAITCFLEKLEIDLKASLGDHWNIRNDLIRDPLHAHVELQVWKNHWLNKCAVVLSPDSSGARDLYVGWHKIQQATEFTPTVEGELRINLEKAYGSVKGAPNWGALVVCQAILQELAI